MSKKPTKKSSSKNKDNQKKLLLLSMLLVVVVILAIFSMINKHNKKNAADIINPSPSSQQTTPTTNQQIVPVEWPVYTDQYDHYSIQYPSGRYIYPSKGSGGSTLITNAPLNFTGGKDFFKVDIVTMKNPKLLTPDEFASDQDAVNEEALGDKITVTNKATISGVNLSGLRWDEKTASGDSAWAVYFSKGDKIYLISTAFTLQDHASEFDSMVRSFKINQ